MQGTNREKELFERAVELTSAAERAALLREACGGDAALLRRLLDLLAAHDATSSFLPGQPGGRPSDQATDEGEGKIIGRYKLLERIGEGGFGVVYMAEQVEPIRRRVAVKIIKPGMDSKQVIGRFEAERQALAMMDHQGIARIFDAGTTASGRPFFAMELVNGVPITTFCTERQLGIEARIRLVITVCSAVQHAHQKGIIHRDLKPSNILVTLHGEQPVPKIIDFGIAKATQEPLTDKTLFTHFQRFMGTPAYMSPEQAALSGLGVDTRSDIYSLGVLLYELLTGSPPFDPKELISAGLDEMRKTICEREPERPSTRLLRCSRAESALASPPRPAPLSRELDLMVLKAIAKDLDRRYATANELAADLRRFLNHEPVLAVAPTVGYQLGKFYRRNRKAVVTAMAFGTLLIAATAVSMGLSVRARRAEAVAKKEAAAELNVSEFFWKEILKQLTPWEHTNRMVSLRQAFDLAGTKIDSRLTNQPLAEASVRLAYGKAYSGLGEFAQAETNLLRALKLRRDHASPPDERTAEILYSLGIVRQFQSQASEAAKLFEEAASIREKVLGPDHRDTLTAAAKAVIIRSGQLPYEKAEPLLRGSVEKLRRFIGPSSTITLATMNHLGAAWLDHGRLEQAFEIFKETHEIAARDDGISSSGSLWGLELMAVAQARQGRFAEADRSFLNLISTRERVNGSHHVFTVGSRLTRIREVQVPQGNFAEAVPALLQIAGQVQASHPSLRPSLAQAQAALNAWQAAGGGPEFEEFQRQVSPFLPLPASDESNQPAFEND